MDRMTKGEWLWSALTGVGAVVGVLSAAFILGGWEGFAWAMLAMCGFILFFLCMYIVGRY